MAQQFNDSSVSSRAIGLKNDHLDKKIAIKTLRRGLLFFAVTWNLSESWAFCIEKVPTNCIISWVLSWRRHPVTREIWNDRKCDAFSNKVISPRHSGFAAVYTNCQFASSEYRSRTKQHPFGCCFVLNKPSRSDTIARLLEGGCKTSCHLCRTAWSTDSCSNYKNNIW